MHSSQRGRSALRLVLLSLLLLVSTCPAWCAPGDAVVAVSIDKLLDDPGLTRGSQGAMVVSLADGRTVYERNSGKLLLPASCLKLLTGAAALDRLGPDFRMETRLFRTGPISKDGVLKGDIVIVGGGDPVFSFHDLEGIAAFVGQSGIRRIQGRVIADDSYFDDVRLGSGWAWDCEPYYYCAEVSALNLDENVVEIQVRPGSRIGGPAAVKALPSVGYVTIRNECRTGDAKSAETPVIDRERGANVVHVRGSIPKGHASAADETSVTVSDPALYAAQAFRTLLGRRGIAVSGRPCRGRKPADAVLVTSHQSPPLSTMLTRLNKHSDNLIAECLLKTLGAIARGKGDSDLGIQAVEGFLKKIGVGGDEAYMVDGSGLSRVNCVTPSCIVSVLRYMRGSTSSAAFMDSLPIAGVDGTMRARLKGTAAEGNARVKTGHLNNVCAVSGFVTTKAGEPVAFCVMLNNHQCTYREAAAIEDAIVAALADMGGDGQ